MITNNDILNALAREIAGRQDRPVKAIIHDNRSEHQRANEKTKIPYERVLDAGVAFDWVRKMGDEQAYLTVWGKKFVYINDEDTGWGIITVLSTPLTPRKYTRWGF